MSYFAKVPLAPPDAILNLTIDFLKDPRPNKVNLGVGIYKTENLKTLLMNCVRTAERAVCDQQKPKDYLPISGLSLYVEKMGALVFGVSFWQKESKRIASFQSVGGTGALKLGGAFIKQEMSHPIWVPVPTWQNHDSIFPDCGLRVERYFYYDKKKHVVEFESFYPVLEKLPEGSIVVMQASCHNPTGSDLSQSQWEKLCALFKQNRLIPFFDTAYQGFGTSIDEDVYPIRLFAKEGLEMFVAASNAKNFSLYGERAGCLFIVSNTPKFAEHISSRVKQIIRAEYSTPPIHGAEIVAHILNTPALRAEWESELKAMKTRINQMREALWELLVAKRPSDSFDHIRNGKGMFGYFGMEKPQVDRLIVEYGIYIANEGRINVCGLNAANLEYVADCLLKVC